MDLFDLNYRNTQDKQKPLAYRMRPRTLNDFVGQKHLLSKGTLLRNAIDKDELHPFILYGPPGTGKTTIAKLIAHKTKSHFESILAVTSGATDIRKIAADAAEKQRYYRQKTILFVDEIHRFNKSQQDVLLPFVEDGTLLLIGATTENPLYELNNALLSRMKIYILNPLEQNEIITIVKNAINDKERGLGQYEIDITEEALKIIVKHAKGDARMALNIVETVVNSYLENGKITINADLLENILGQPLYKYDATGDYHYDTISAFIKSIRGSDPDAAVFWLAVMLEGGEDPKFIARRLVIHAAEDIGLADPNALNIAVSAAHAVEIVGMPEARIPLAEATLYLSTAPKSNSSKTAIDNAIASVRKSNKIQVPAHIASSSHSQASKLLGKGIGYKYPHDYGGYVKQTYLPQAIKYEQYYFTTFNGYEKTIAQFLEQIKKQNNLSDKDNNFK